MLSQSVRLDNSAKIIGILFILTGGQKPHFVEKGREIPCNPGNYVPFVVPVLSTASSSSRAESTASTPEWQDLRAGYVYSRASEDTK